MDIAHSERSHQNGVRRIMIQVKATLDKASLGLTPAEAAEVARYDVLRQADIISIRRFVAAQKHCLAAGRVLDYGAGKPGTCRRPQPYRDLVAAEEYVPFDLGDPMPEGDFDSILCTQVLQMHDSPRALLAQFASWLRCKRGALVLTYNTNWPEGDPAERWRFTKNGMTEMLQRAGFIVGVHDARCSLIVGPNEFVTGYGVLAMVNA